MGLREDLRDRLKALEQFSPKNLRKLTNERVSDFIDKETVRARKRVEELTQRYPSAGPRELSQRLIDQKKQLAAMVGGMTGLFGVVTVPVDLAGMVYLQLSLLIEVALVFKANLKSEKTRAELLDLFGDANGIGPFKRSTPKVVGSLAAALLAKGGLKTLSRAMPLVAAPVSAYLNNQHVQRVGEAAVRHHDGWPQAHAKAKNLFKGP